jgi:ribosome-binding protein aMBF1 (putative translation factor)
MPIWGFLESTSDVEVEPAQSLPFQFVVSWEPSLSREPPRSRRNGAMSFSDGMNREEARHPEYQNRLRAARRILAAEYEAAGKAESIALLRLKLGLSQKELADKIGTSQSHIAKIEAGDIKLYFHTATRLADALGVGLDRLRRMIDRDGAMTGAES